MRVYENYSQSPDGWNTESTLKLEDDGQFRYDETWTDYAGSTGVTVEGSWRRDGDAIVLHPQQVDGSVGRWVAGQERKGVERGDTLDFGNGFTLRIPPEREEDIPIRNNSMKPLTIILEPWSTQHVVAPGERVRIVARGPGGLGRLELVRSTDEVVVYGWSGAQVAVVREQKPTQTTVQTRVSWVEAPSPLVTPPVTPHASAPVAETISARFEPRTPSPELAALIRRWVDELPVEGMQNYIKRLCKGNDAIPLHCTQIYLWALRPDGQVLCIDHESAAQRAELEDNPVRAYAALAQGARTYPNLNELLTHNPAGARPCEDCEGKGWRPAQSPAQSTDPCDRCDGMGWYALRAPR